MAKTGISKMLDPMDLWRDALTQWEGGANATATKQMGSEEFAQALHAMAGVSTGIQQAVGQANGALLKELNLPSRNDLIDIGARLQRIEEAIEQLTQRLGGVAPAPAAAPRTMPPRTRKPPSAASAAAPESRVPPAPPAKAVKAVKAAPPMKAATARGKKPLARRTQA